MEVYCCIETNCKLISEGPKRGIKRYICIIDQILVPDTLFWRTEFRVDTLNNRYLGFPLMKIEETESKKWIFYLYKDLITLLPIMYILPNLSQVIRELFTIDLHINIHFQLIPCELIHWILSLLLTEMKCRLKGFIYQPCVLCKQVTYCHTWVFTWLFCTCSPIYYSYLVTSHLRLLGLPFKDRLLLDT